MNFRHLLGLCAALAAAAFPIAASAYSEDEPLSMVFSEEQSSTDRSREGTVAAAAAAWPSFQGCAAGLGKVEDTRINKTTAGGWTMLVLGVPLHAGSLASGDGRKWLQSALATIEATGLKNAQPGARGVDVALRGAQVWLAGMNMQSHVILSVTFPGAQGASVTRRYHGFGTRVNGVNANTEYMATLNLGMLDALRGFAADLDRYCTKGAI